MLIFIFFSQDLDNKGYDLLNILQDKTTSVQRDLLRVYNYAVSSSSLRDVFVEVRGCGNQCMPRLLNYG